MPPQKSGKPWQYGGFKKAAKEERGKIAAQEVAQYQSPLIGWIFYRSKQIISLIIIIFVIWYAWQIVKDPLVRESFLQRLRIFSQRGNIEERIASVSPTSTTSSIKQQIAGIGEFKRPDYQEPPKETVSLLTFDPIPNKIYEGSPIKLRSNLELEGHQQDDLSLTFECTLHKSADNEIIQQGKVTIDGAKEGQTTYTLQPRQHKKISVFCDFMPITSIETVSQNAPYGMYTAYLSWTHEKIITQTRMRIYTQ